MKMKKDRKAERQRINQEIRNLCEKGRFTQTIRFVQHGDISVCEHCIAVAYLSVRIARALPIHMNYRALIRGALLHDYFLYDWHEKDRSHSLHGFRHPGKAVKNAGEDFRLSKREQNIILRHMFPLTVIPPACREAWIVCIADKICAVAETLHLSRRSYRRYVKWIKRNFKDKR